ncbi:MAG: MoaD/ThiS family protein [Chloroflexi bacterium]|nr:MoaD/ThiS family protein [Chloroflexota bacterium]
MPVRVYIPTPFRRFTANREYVSVEGETVRAVLDALDDAYPGFDHLVYDREGRVPAHINIYVNNRAIDELAGVETELSDGDQMAVIPALAGGAR